MNFVQRMVGMNYYVAFSPSVKSAYQKIFFLFLNQNICFDVLGTQKNSLNEMVLLSTQIIC